MKRERMMGNNIDTSLKGALWIGVLSLSLLSMPVHATNLGVIGDTVAISEEDFLSFIEHKLSVMQSNGEWQRIQKGIQDQVGLHVDRPMSVFNVSRTTHQRTEHYDPSIIVPYDLHDMHGLVFAKAGTRFNPLSITTLHTEFVFYDGDDKPQVDWARKMAQRNPGKYKFVLVNGSVSSQEKLFHQPIYFDQQGRLISKFHIQHTPALVYQEGLHLTISEVLP